MGMAGRHLALMFAINVVWGFNLVASKYGLLELPPLLLTSLRFGLLFVLLLRFLRWHAGQMGAVLFCGLTLGALHFGLVFAGLARADDVSAVAIAVQLGVPFTTLVSVVWLGEQVGWRRWLGVLLSFCGVLFMGLDPVVFRYIGGLLLVVAAAFVAALGVPASKRLQNIGVFELQAWIAAISAPLLFIGSLLTEAPSLHLIADVRPLTWAAVAYTALGASLVGHGGLYYLVQRYDVSLVAPMTLLAPLFGVVFGVTLMGDNLTPRMIAGGTMTLIGVYIIARRQARAGVRLEHDGAAVAGDPRRSGS